jgi:threonine dehydrogenase-like Zn-dependent dehydrogenase
VTSERIDLEPIVTHRVSLEEAPEALALQSRYDDGIIKAAVYQDAA